MRSRQVAFSAIALALFSAFVSYWQFSRCIPSGWSSPDVYQKGCYTDITALYQSRNFVIDAWPYGSGSESFEYPVLSGLGIWLISLLTRDGSAGLQQFFLLNIFSITLLFITTVLLLGKFDKRNSYIYAISPAVILALFINWDMWAIAAMLASLHLLQKREHSLSGVLLAVGIFLKFFPILLVIPILLFLRRDIRQLRDFVVGLVATTLVINLPLVVTEFDGWAKFYIFNYKRGVDFGSIWYLISLHGSWITNVNQIATPILGCLILVISIRYRDNFRAAMFLTSVAFFTLNKVYSPQYVLWLAAIALVFFKKNRIFYTLFFIWQLSEVLYQYGIWRYILTVLNESGGITADTYTWISIIRILALMSLTGYGIYQTDLFKDNLIERSSGKANG